jgi:putative ABC transport system permease protein
VRLGDRGENGALPPVTAIYADLNDPVDPWWCSERTTVVRNPLGGDGQVASVIWLPSAESFQRLPERLTGATNLTLRFPQHAVPRTVDEAQALLTGGESRLDRITEQVRDGRLTRGSYLAGPISAARQTAANVRSAILPLTLISLLVGLAGLGTVTVQWAQRRHTELRMLWCRGSGPLALGGRAVLELGLPLVLGGVLGLIAARSLLPVYSPSTALAGGVTTTAALAVLAVVAGSTLVVVLVATAHAHREFQSAPAAARSRARRVLAAVPWELATAGLAWLAWRRLLDNGLGTEQKLGALPRIDAAALAFPLLVVLTTALVAARLVRLALRLSHRANLWRAPAAQLALRRLAAAAGPVTGVLLVGVLAIGTIAVGTSVANAQQTSLTEKSGMFVGANSTVQVSMDMARGGVEMPAELRGTTTLVGVSTNALVVDPETFTDGAWLGGHDPARLTAQLKGLVRTGDTAPAIRLGRTPEQGVRLPGLPTLDPRERLGAFPKLGTRGYVVARDSVPAVDQVGSWHLWSSRPLAELTAPLRAAGLHYTNVQDRTTVLDGLPFLTVEWTFGFVTAIGAVLAVVAATALLLAIEVRRRQNAVSGALSARMGMRWRTLLGSHLVELGALALVAVVVGGTASAISTGFAVPELDPAPWLNPSPVLPDLLPLLLTTLGVAALVVAGAAWTALRTARAARIGELIRG